MYNNEKKQKDSPDPDKYYFHYINLTFIVYNVSGYIC